MSKRSGFTSPRTQAGGTSSFAAFTRAARLSVVSRSASARSRFASSRARLHTSSGADVTDEWAETILKNGDAITYQYGNEQRPVTTEVVTLKYKGATGPATKDFTANGWAGAKDLKGFSNCFVVMQVKNGKFERLYPEIGGKGDDGDGFHCPANALVDITADAGKGNVDPSRGY